MLVVHGMDGRDKPGQDEGVGIGPPVSLKGRHHEPMTPEILN